MLTALFCSSAFAGERGEFIVPGKQFIRYSTTQGQFTCISFERNSSLWDCPLASLPPPPLSALFIIHGGFFFFVFWHLNVCLSHSALVFTGLFWWVSSKVSDVKRHLPHVCVILTCLNSYQFPALQFLGNSH